MTPIQQQQLQALVQQPAYANLSDAAAATLASTPTYQPVPYLTFQPAVMQLACWGTVRAAAANVAAQPAALQPVILTAVDLFTNYAAPNVDMSLPAFQQALGALEQAGLVTASDGAAILALGQVLPVGAAVQTSDVTAARAVIAVQQWCAAKVAAIQSGTGGATALVNAYQNGTGPQPTNAQINAAFAGQVGN